MITIFYVSYYTFSQQFSFNMMDANQQITERLFENILRVERIENTKQKLLIDFESRLSGNHFTLDNV